MSQPLFSRNSAARGLATRRCNTPRASVWLTSLAALALWPAFLPPTAQAQPARTVGALARKEPVDYVNPNMGGISQLLVPTFPTVHLPHGMMRIYPNRESYTSEYISGLPMMVANHRDGSAIDLKPFDAVNGDAVNGQVQPPSRYAYDQESLAPYRYAVRLEDQNTDVVFAPAEKSALYTLRYSGTQSHYLLLDAGDGDGEWKVQGNTLSGSRRVNGSARLYMSLTFSAPPQQRGVWENGAVTWDRDTSTGNKQSLVLGWPGTTRQLSLRYGVSYISADQARQNLDTQIKDFDVEKQAQAARRVWNASLGRLAVEGTDENDKAVFYTSLYRASERMVNISEGGRYFSGFDNQVHADNGIPFYTDDWIWDTYRALHPLQTLIDPQGDAAEVTSFLRMASQNTEGWVPTFPDVGGDSHRMNGNHYVSVIWDAYSKGLPGFDLAAAYAACKKTIMEETMIPWTRANATPLDAFYREKGYFPALKPGERETVREAGGFEKRQPVAVTLAAAYDDWCLAQMAKALGKTEDYQYFLGRSYNYRNLFNPTTSFFHPKDSDGNFIQPFDYKFSGGLGARDYYDENNAWTYRWDVPHNVADLVQLMGGREKFVANLDQLFAEDLGRSRYGFYNQLPDQTGNVGQFSMGNEPSMHIPYLYNYAGAPWKTQKRVRSLLSMWFRNDLQGVPGDEDGGGLSAFVVFSSMGFYPVTPGTLSYNIGSPLFTRTTMKLGNGKTFVIEAPNSSHTNKYIQSARLNGRPWNKPWLSHRDIMNGGRLELVMGSLPNKTWGAAPEDAPPSQGPKS